MEIEALIRNDLLMKEIGRRIARLRIRQGWTQEEFARRAGISRSGLQRLEAGDAGVRLVTFAAALRILGRLQSLNSVIPGDVMTPLEIARMTKLVSAKTPKRVSLGKRRNGRLKTWGDGTPMGEAMRKL